MVHEYLSISGAGPITVIVFCVRAKPKDFTERINGKDVSGMRNDIHIVKLSFCKCSTRRKNYNRHFVEKLISCMYYVRNSIKKIILILQQILIVVLTEPS